MKIPKIENMRSRKGNKIANQFIIWTGEGKYFQSYNTIIAFRSIEGKVTLDRDEWDYSVTTGKYRNIFLHETKKETEQNIKMVVYTLEDLNI